MLFSCSEEFFNGRTEAIAAVVAKSSPNSVAGFLGDVFQGLTRLPAAGFSDARKRGALHVTECSGRVLFPV